MFSDLLRADRGRNGFTVEQATRRPGVSEVAYRKLDAGERWPRWETYDRVEEIVRFRRIDALRKRLGTK
jgi:hypothetical protein